MSLTLEQILTFNAALIAVVLIAVSVSFAVIKIAAAIAGVEDREVGGDPS